MKVLEKYLSMSIDEQLEDYFRVIKENNGAMFIGEVFAYLNSEVELTSNEAFLEEGYEYYDESAQEIAFCHQTDDTMIYITENDAYIGNIPYGETVSFSTINLLSGIADRKRKEKDWKRCKIEK